MSKVASIVDVLQGKIAIGEKVTVRGWVRTRRDSKAGLSFLAVYDAVVIPKLVFLSSLFMTALALILFKSSSITILKIMKVKYYA